MQCFAGLLCPMKLESPPELYLMKNENKKLMRKIASMMKVVVLLLLIFSLPSYGQSQTTVSETIMDADKKIPLAGVTVKVTGTNTTTQTNEKGAFTIKAT